MNLRYLSDHSLTHATNLLVLREREILTEILHHLREIERRRLFSSLGYKSLFDYAVKKLGYSEDQAYRRISAMRLLKEVPELEEKLESGALNITHLNLAQSLFRKEEKLQQTRISKKDKLEVLERLEKQTTKEAQKIVLSLSSEPNNLILERSRQLTPNLTELRFTVNDETLKKIERLKGQYAHTNPNISLSELFDKLCDQAINSGSFQKSCVKATQCENCHSTHALQIDHILPRAKGGTNDPENLRTLCRSCNQRAAIKEFGQQKMDKYIN